MTVLSSRHAPALVVLLVVAALPVWFHAAVAPIHDDCASPAAFFGAAQLAGTATAPLHGPLGGIEGVEGRSSRHGRSLGFRVVRSFDPSRFYARPIAFGFDTLQYLRPGEIQAVQAGEDSLPVHWRSREVQALARVEAYLYAQGGAAVRHPARSGLALALPQLVSGTRPVTLLIVSGTAPRDELPELRRDVAQWLAELWQAYEAACGR